MTAILRLLSRAYPSPYDQAECVASFISGQPFDLDRSYSIQNCTCQYWNPAELVAALDDAYLGYDPSAKTFFTDCVAGAPYLTQEAPWHGKPAPYITLCIVAHVHRVCYNEQELKLDRQYRRWHHR